MSPLRRSRLLKPSRFGRYRNHGRRCALAYRTNRDSLSNPNSAEITASVTSSASDSFGANPTAGRSGAHSGCATNKSSILTYSAVARVSKSGFMPKVLRDRGLWITPSLDTLNPHMVDPTPWN